LWLRRASIGDFPATLTEQAIATLCGIAARDSTPVASLTYLEDFGELPPGYCLRADPVHLRADTSGLILFDTASFELDNEESRGLCDALAGHLAADGWELRQRHPHRWYLVGGAPQDLGTLALPAVRGTPVPAVPYSGADAAAWINRVNELQMLLHSHPVNRARAARGRVAVNSLWLWGGGELQHRGSAACSRVLSDNPFARGSAHYCGLKVLPGPAAAEQVTPADDGQLVVLEDCRDAAAYQDLPAWRAAVLRLERNWFEALIRSLKAGKLDALELYPVNGRAYRLTRRRLLALWKGRGDYRGDRAFRGAGLNRV
jgi:hypothetical protein